MWTSKGPGSTKKQTRQNKKHVDTINLMGKEFIKLSASVIFNLSSTYTAGYFNC